MIKIRSYDDSDRAAFAELLLEMQLYYIPEAPTAQKIENDLLAPPEGVEFLVAESDGALAGFAAFSTLYPGHVVHPQFYLKELYVSENHRRRGIGTKLMAELVRIAIRRGYTRIDWTANKDDDMAARFYEKIGAEALPKKIYHRLEDETLMAAAKKLGVS